MLIEAVKQTIVLLQISKVSRDKNLSVLVRTVNMFLLFVA